RAIARSCGAGRAVSSHRQAISTRPPRTSSACSRIPPCAAASAPPRPSGCTLTSTKARWLRAWPGSTPRCCAAQVTRCRPLGRLMKSVPFFRPEIDDGDIAAVLDVDPETLCMDPAALESALDGRSDRATEIVGGIPVHYGGQMASMPRLARALRASGCFVVEDAAHALPAAVHDAATGRWVCVGALAD